MDPMAMGGAPPMDPMAMGGAPPMDPMGGMGMGGPPTMPMAAPGAPSASREEIGSPLDSLGKILYDVDITTLLLSRIGDTADDTALYIWLMYGGDEHGGSMNDRIGKRLKRLGRILFCSRIIQDLMLSSYLPQILQAYISRYLLM